MIVQNDNVLTVTGPMLIANARALLEAGRGFLQQASGSDGAEQIVLDLSSAEETDSSALSVVFALLRSARQSGLTMRVAHPPASMISQAALYGADDCLPLA